MSSRQSPSLYRIRLSGWVLILWTLAGASFASPAGPQETLALSPRESLEQRVAVLKAQGRAGRVIRVDLSRTHTRDGDLKALRGLPNIRELDLFRTRVSNAAVDLLSQLPHLEKLNLAYTGIDDTGAMGLLDIERLRAVDLSVTNVTEEGFLALAAKPSLEVLKLSGCSIDSGAFHRLKPNKTLKTLDLSFTFDNITDDGIEYIERFRALETLEIGNSSIGDKGAQVISLMASLEVLSLKKTRISGLALALMADLDNLRHLDISSNSRIQPNDLMQLRALDQLEFLDLTYLVNRPSEEQLRALRQALPGARIAIEASTS